MAFARRKEVKASKGTKCPLGVSTQCREDVS